MIFLLTGKYRIQKNRNNLLPPLLFYSSGQVRTDWAEFDARPTALFLFLLLVDVTTAWGEAVAPDDITELPRVVCCNVLTPFTVRLRFLGNISEFQIPQCMELN